MGVLKQPTEPRTTPVDAIFTYHHLYGHVRGRVGGARTGATFDLLTLLGSVPDPRDPRGVRHPLPAILSVGLAAVLAGARSFVAIGEWVAHQSSQALTTLGVGGAAGPTESTIRRAFARVDADVLDQVLGALMWTRSFVASGRREIAIDGKTIRGARHKDSNAPHLVAAFDHAAATPPYRCTVPRRMCRPWNISPACGWTILPSWTGPGSKDITDALDGVEIFVPANYTDPSGTTWEEGNQVLDGEGALQYVRTRYGLPNGDLDRVARQQNFLRALRSQVLDAGTLTNPFTATRTVRQWCAT